MLRATVAVGNIWLAVFAVLMAAVSVYYYFRLIQAMYFKEGNATIAGQVSPAFKITLVAVAAVTIILGVYPNLLLYWLYF
jgi:NADH-quinone oxidoreductase subunit N